MKISYFAEKLLLPLLFCTVLSTVGAEPFRVGSLHSVQISDEPETSQTAKLGLNDAIAIFLPENKTFLQGLEVKMDIPEVTALWRDCCALYVYEKINPYPQDGQIDFTGQKAFFGVLPGKLSWILQIPLIKDNNFKTNQYTAKMDTIPDTTGNFIFLRLQQIMKGVPDEVIDSEITFTVKPIFLDKGLLLLSTDAEEDKKDSISYFIDEIPYSREQIEKGVLLDTGVHNISAISEYYRTEVRTVRLDKAKNTELNLKMRSIEPTLIIIAPDGAQVFLDDEAFADAGKEVTITEGDHKIRFVVGEYEIMRSISVVKGKTYTANLTVDLQISEE